MILLALDLDATLLGDDPAMTDLLAKLKNLKQKGTLRVVYATGRSYESYQQGLKRILAEAPDAFIAACGTEIYIDDMLIADWSESFGRGWDREAIAQLALQKTSFKLQPASEQLPYKVSLETDVPNHDDVVALNQALQEAFPQALAAVSHGGQYIDITPKVADKGSAVRYLARQWAIDHHDIIAAGDSANDLSMLLVSKAIIVGNAYQELRDALAKHPNAEVYFATKQFAAGIAEGLSHFMGKNWDKS